MDTSNESAHIESVFSIDKGDDYADNRLKNMEKAIQSYCLQILKIK